MQLLCVRSWFKQFELAWGNFFFPDMKYVTLSIVRNNKLAPMTRMTSIPSRRLLSRFNRVMSIPVWHWVSNVVIRVVLVWLDFCWISGCFILKINSIVGICAGKHFTVKITVGVTDEDDADERRGVSCPRLGSFFRSARTLHQNFTRILSGYYH